MATTGRSVHYRRQGSTGVIALQGTVDIFEASTVHATAIKALRDTKATSIRVDLAQVERLDLSIVQILATLQRDVEALGRRLFADGASANIQECLSLSAVSL